jgi:hypothetical protein
MPEVTQVSEYPWQPQSLLLGNLAIGNLRENLLRVLRNERGIHAESLIAAIGALAGFAAQNAALIEGVQASQQQGAVPKDSIVLVGTKTGERYFFGEWINRHLFNERGSRFSLFGFTAGAAISAGLDEKSLPNCAEIAGHIGRSIGTPAFGTLRAPADHPPSHQPVEFVRMLWAWAEKLLRLPLPEPMQQSNEPPLKEVWWPIIANNVAGQVVRATKDVLNPAISLPMLIEAALTTSKIDPEMIVPGKWRFETKAGTLKISAGNGLSEEGQPSGEKGQ